MSTEATEQTPAPGKLKPILLLVVAAVASLALGGALGAFALAPMLGPAAPAPRAAAVDSTADEAEGAGGESGASEEPAGKGGSGSRTMHTLDNLVLNPAQSNGTRFVMVSLAFELRSAGASEALNQREAELRDVVLRVLGSKTVDDLARLGARDSLKIELRDSVRTLLPRNTLNRVYLTQFVIQ